MKILFIAQWAGAPNLGMVYGHYHLSKEWVSQGHDVTILAASYSHTRFKQPIGEYSTTIDGIKYIWIKVNKYSSTSSLGRLLSMIIFTCRCFFYRGRGFDIVISSSHHPFSIYPAVRIAKKCNAKVVFEIRDLWPESLIQLAGVCRRHPLVVLMSMAELYALKKANYVVSTLELSNEYLTGLGITTEKWRYMPNGVSYEGRLLREAPLITDKTSSLLSYTKNLATKKRFNLVYCGNLGLANNLDSLVDAAQLLDANLYCIHVFGLGPELENLVCRGLDSEAIVFYGRISRSEVEQVLEQADVAYISYRNLPLYSYGISPTKLNDYLAAGLPVLFAADFSIGELENLSFIIRTKDSAEDVASSIVSLSQNSLILGHLGERAKEWIISNRNYRDISVRYLDSLS